MLSRTKSVQGSEIVFVTPELEYPWSQPDDVQLYRFSVKVFEEGMESGFYSAHCTSIDGYKSYFEDEKYVYLGRHSMCMEEIVPPVYEEKSEEWKSNVEKAIQMYMDENDYYTSNGYSKLKPGKYKVYVKNFTKADLYGVIFFEHEDGDVYSGRYRFVNTLLVDASNFTHVNLWGEYTMESWKSYFEKVKANPAICVEYEVKEKS